VVPDGQPVKWTMNLFHRTALEDRVSGYELTLAVLEKANKLGLKVYLYGSVEVTLIKFTSFIKENYPNIKITGMHPDRFRDATPAEDIEDSQKINKSGADIVLVGRGCPRQERWVAGHLGKINAPMMAIGAVFDFCAETTKRAPLWMQNTGLEWLYRLYKEPKRLWKRYLITNSIFIYLFIKGLLKNRI
jgi:N-acetylglucosaminyldiphosphoundecaprenol N-acetyl-beta-D-mannosaminyltransferase